MSVFHIFRRNYVSRSTSSSLWIACTRTFEYKCVFFSKCKNRIFQAWLNLIIKNLWKLASELMVSFRFSNFLIEWKCLLTIYLLRIWIEIIIKLTNHFIFGRGAVTLELHCIRAHTYTHANNKYAFLYIYMCLCVCMCMYIHEGQVPSGRNKIGVLWNCNGLRSNWNWIRNKGQRKLLHIT